MSAMKSGKSNAAGRDRKASCRKSVVDDKGGGVPFGSSYYCHRLLPKQIVFEELAVCRNDYSRMHRDVDNLNRNIAEEDAGLSFGVV